MTATKTILCHEHVLHHSCPPSYKGRRACPPTYVNLSSFLYSGVSKVRWPSPCCLTLRQNLMASYVHKYVRTQESPLDMSLLFSMCPAPVWTHVHCFNMQICCWEVCITQTEFLPSGLVQSDRTSSTYLTLSIANMTSSVQSWSLHCWHHLPATTEACTSNPLTYLLLCVLAFWASGAYVHM